MAKKEASAKHIFLLLFVLLIIISLLIIKPYLITIISSLLLAYVFYPIHKKILNKIKKPRISALITLLIISLLIFVPLIISTIMLAQQGKIGVNILKDTFEQGYQTIEQSQSGIFGEGMMTLIDKLDLKGTLGEIVEKITNYAIAQATSIVLAVPAFLMKLFISLFLTYYLLIDGKKLLKYIFNIISFKKQYKTILQKKINDIVDAVIYGHFFTALIQGIVGGLGFLIFGFSSPLFWGTMMAFGALIPFVGAAIVWVPAVIIKLTLDIIQQDTTGIIVSIIFIFYGLFVISGIDNIIRPKIIGDKADIHPVIILLGVIGGLSLLGFIGIFIGPLILSVLITFIDIYLKER